MYVISATVKYFNADTKRSYAVDSFRDGGLDYCWGPIQDVGLLRFDTIESAEEWYSIHKKDLASTHSVEVKDIAITEIVMVNIKSLSE